MAIKHKTRVKETASNKPNASTAFSLPGSAATGYRTFASAYADTDQLPYHATNGTDWESGIATFTTGVPNTLVRSVIYESSNANAAVDFSAGANVDVFVEWPAKLGEFAHNPGYISGLSLTYSSGTALIIEAGTIVIDNKPHTLAQTTVTSGSTMTDLSGAAVTIGASKAYFVYVYNNAGTPEIRVQERTGTGNGADPTFDSALDYWKGPVAGSRRIGKFIVNASTVIIPFKNYVYGRYRYIQFNNITVNTIPLVNLGTATTYTSVTMTPFITADDDSYWVSCSVRKDTSTGTGQLLISCDGGTNEILNVLLNAILTSGSYIGSLMQKVINTGTLHYKVGTSCSGNVRIAGWEYSA